MDMALGLLDAGIEGTLMIADADQLNDQFLGEVDTRSDEGSCQDVLHDACPLLWAIVRACGESLEGGDEATAQPTSERGISNLFRQAYFLVPGLTTPQRNTKIHGRHCAKSLATQILRPYALDPDEEPEDANPTDLCGPSCGAADGNWNCDQGRDWKT